MQRTLRTFILLSLLSAFAFADKIPPTSGGAYYCGTQKVGYTVYFQGLGYDNDSQNGGQTPYYRWDFDSDYEFSPDLTTTSWLVSHTYTEAGKHIVGVQYVDDDGQEGGVYVFEITIESDSLRRYYYLKDHLGSIRVTVDAQGVVKGYDDYDPWGMVLEGRSSNTANVNDKYKFTGKERDVETGYDYFGARYYDSRIGRWMSVDPMQEKYPGWSPYNYTCNNPLVYVDATGNDPSTYTDEGGNVTSVTDDDSKDLFCMQEDGSYKLMGQTVDAHSFVDQEHPYNSDGSLNAVGRIDYNSTFAGDEIASSLKDVGSHFITRYAMHAHNEDIYDLKSQTYQPERSYFGSLLRSGVNGEANVYASARDAGNILAGAAAAQAGYSYDFAMSGFGAYQVGFNTYILGAGVLLSAYSLNPQGGLNFLYNYGETPISHAMQSYGYMHYRSLGR